MKIFKRNDEIEKELADIKEQVTSQTLPIPDDKEVIITDWDEVLISDKISFGKNTASILSEDKKYKILIPFQHVKAIRKLTKKPWYIRDISFRDISDVSDVSRGIPIEELPSESAFFWGFKAVFESFSFLLYPILTSLMSLTSPKPYSSFNFFKKHQNISF